MGVICGTKGGSKEFEPENAKESYSTEMRILDYDIKYMSDNAWRRFGSLRIWHSGVFVKRKLNNYRLPGWNLCIYNSEFIDPILVVLIITHTRIFSQKYDNSIPSF